MDKKLTLDSFNDILFEAFKDQSPKSKKKLLVMEINFGYSSKVIEMENLVDALNKGIPYHKILENVNKIDINLEHLSKNVQELEEKYPELKESIDDGDD